jgi:hypothetical protein
MLALGGCKKSRVGHNFVSKSSLYLLYRAGMGAIRLN